MRAARAVALALAVAACGEGQTPKPAGDAAAGPADSTAPPDQVVDAGAADASIASEVARSVDAGPPDVGGRLAEAGRLDTAGCKPVCKGKICGPDGCGSLCGFCASGKFCAPDGSSCSAFCEKNCTDKACGNDGCNGVCGTCKAGFHCGDDSKCYPDACEGSCDGKACGDDGCGKSCGSCAGTDYCVAGACKSSACKGIDAKEGSCEGDLLLSCQGEGAAAKKVVKDCAAPPNLQNLTCAWDAAQSKYACVAKTCDPSCKTDAGLPIVCGNNGCGNPCGACPTGWKCSVTACAVAAGASCTPTNFPVQGECQDTVWVYCNTGKIVMVDCAKAGFDTCGWNKQAGKYECL